ARRRLARHRPPAAARDDSPPTGTGYPTRLPQPSRAGAPSRGWPCRSAPALPAHPGRRAPSCRRATALALHPTASRACKPRPRRGLESRCLDSLILGSILTIFRIPSHLSLFGNEAPLFIHNVSVVLYKRCVSGGRELRCRSNLVTVDCHRAARQNL